MRPSSDKSERPPRLLLRRYQLGYTLLEMTLVVALLGIIAAVAVPALAPASQEKLDLAGVLVADAFRIARDRSRQTGVVHGVSVDLANNRLRVFRLDEASNPNAKMFDVYHPVSKQLYTVQLNAAPLERVMLTGSSGTLIGACAEPQDFAFRPSGVVTCIEPTTSRFSGVQLSLAIDSLTLSTSIDSYTGRVTTQ